MANISQIQASPFFDDYNPELRDFLRVLFRPGRAVQARELNQLQSILQTQVERFANHIFKDGSIIYGGGTTIDTISARYLKIEDYIPTTTNPVVLSSLINKKIKGKTSGAVALVTTYAARSGLDPNTLIIKNLNGEPFQGGEVLDVVVQDTNGNYIQDSAFPTTGVATIVSSSFYGNASTVSIADSIFYTKGMFVICPSQTVPLDKYSNVPNKIAGLISAVQIVTENEDSTLLDNATGTYNYSAPGASRLKINLTLTSKDLNYTPSTDEDFIELLEVRDGKLYKQISRPTYNELMRMLARRTFNESGNYTVKPFLLDLKPHPTDDTKLRAYLSPGLAYINGFEFETIATQYVDINKARDTETYNNYGISIYYDNYFIVKSSTAAYLPNISGFEQLTIKDAVDATIGTCYARSLVYNNATTYKLYVFNISLNAGKTVSDIKKFTFATGGQLEIDTTPAVLYGSTNNRLIFNTGFSKVSGIIDISTYYQKVFTGVSVTANTATISVSTPETFYSTTATDYIVVNATGGSLVSVSSVVISGGTQAQLTLGLASGTVNIIANIRNTTANKNIKTLINVKTSQGYIETAASNTSILKLANYEPTSTSGYYNGCKIKLISGTGAGSTIYTITSYSDSTREATISGGPIANVDQTTYYEIMPAFTAGTTNLSAGYYHTTTIASEIVIPNSYDGISLVKVYKNMTVDTDWFDSTKDITYMFEFNNGQTDEYYGPCKIRLKPGHSLSGVTSLHIFFNRFTHQIQDGFFTEDSYPSETSNAIYTYSDADGNVVDLKNCIDFRPTYIFDGSTYSFLSTEKMPIPYSLMSADVSYYLGKVVKIVATADNSFVVLEGISSLTPKAPADVDYGMTLYIITLAPYTYNENYAKVKYIENKRYTMRDIGKLEKRIENIEYYTSLSLLENSAASLDVKDGSGLTRFKNGILVDSFEGHSVGDVFNPDYKCSIDVTKRELRPLFKQRAFTLYPLVNTNVTISSNNLATKNYTLATYISQTKASRKVNINPYSVFLWRGSVTLTPSTDIWKDTKVRPSNISNQNGNNNNLLSNIPWNTSFNEWNNNWVGISSTSRFETRQETEFVERWEPDLRPLGNLDLWMRNAANARLSWVDPYTGDQLQTPIYVFWNRTPDGTERAVATIPATRTTEARVVSRPTGNTVITETQVRPTVQMTSTNLGNVVVNVDFIPYIRPRTISFTATGLKPDTTVYVFFDNVLVNQYITNANPSSFKTNSSGQFSGKFNIPSNKFLVGERVFRITDSSTNNREQETTFAETKYFAQGLEEEEVTLSVNTPTIGMESRQVTRVVQPVDPLAQSFFVDPIIYPEGIFIKEVDIYFASKDNAIPVLLQIRENENGYPSNIKVLAEKMLPASSVNTSSTGATATTFSFDNPIYLKPGEYSLVLISNSDSYEAWVAKIGENDVSNNTLISAQPYVGSLFKSQNASTWTAEQTEDLKFVIRKCNFTTGSFNITLSDFVSSNEPDIYTEVPILQDATSGTNILYLGNMEERNIIKGAVVYHAAIPGGTTITDINYIENKVTLSSNITANISKTSTSGVMIGVKRKAESDGTNVMDLFKANLSIFNPFSSSSISYSFKSKLWAGSSLEATATNFTPENNYEFNSPRQIDVAQESFNLIVSGNVNSTHVSPVINLNRNYIVAVENVINNPGTLTETTATGGNANCRYIIRKVSLENTSSYLKVYFDLYRPLNTDVKVYYRVLLNSDSVNLEEKSWTELSSVQNISNVYSNKATDFFETIWAPSSNDIGDFNELQIKIVLLSSNTSIIPKVKNLRVLALD